jgi:5-formyltetrahydrofolate cyclo-ligase
MRGKPNTRRNVLSRRDALTADARAVASTAIAARVDELLATLSPGSLIALYAAKDSEVATDAIDVAARARGLAVAYPRIVDGARRLELCIAAPDTLVVGRFGLREPARDVPAVDVASIAAFVVPGVAFDTHGGRVGWGRGYYDATLAAAAPWALRIGIAFDAQLVDDVPREAHDIVLHYVITETTTHRGAAD